LLSVWGKGKFRKLGASIDDLGELTGGAGPAIEGFVLGAVGGLGIDDVGEEQMLAVVGPADRLLVVIGGLVGWGDLLSGQCEVL
jgi:hypothetical protein